MGISKAIPTELGTKKISSLLKQYAIPGIIAMTAVSLYNMVDSIYIGHIQKVGSLAISGLAVTFPFMNLAVAFGTLVGIGAATIISVLLGQKNYEGANKVLFNELVLSSIISILFTIIGLIFLEPILYFFGASANTIIYAKGYMKIILIGNIVTNLYFSLNNCIRASGNPRLAMYLTIFTVICNSILDPLLIFGLNMGIQGAAIGTVISQILALIYTLWYFTKPKALLRIQNKGGNIEFRIVKDILTIGMGPFLMNAAACIVALFINQQLKKYGGDLSIGAYGIVNRISFFFIMIIMGFNQGMQPIAGYNFGARKYKRMKEVYVYTMLWSTFVSILCFIISEFIPNIVCSVFTSDIELKHLAEFGLSRTNILFFLVGFQMISTMFFQCIGMVKTSILLSLARQLLFLVPLLYFIPIYFDAKSIWYCFPISDFLSSILTLIMILLLFKKVNNLKDGDDPSVLGSQI